MEPLTERLAAVSPQTVVLIVAFLTAARVLLRQVRGGTARLLADSAESVLVALVLVFLLLRPFVAQTFFIPSGSMHPTLLEGDRILVNKWTYRNRLPERGDVVVFRAPLEASSQQKDFVKRLIAVEGDLIEVREGYVVIEGLPPFTHGEVRAVLGLGQSADAVREVSDEIPLRLTPNAVILGARRIPKAELVRLAVRFAVRSGAKVRPGARGKIVPGRIVRNGVTLCEDYVAEDPGYHWGPQIVPKGALFVLGDNRNASHDGHIWGMLATTRIIGRADVRFWPPKRVGRVPSDTGCGEEKISGDDDDAP